MSTLIHTHIPGFSTGFRCNKFQLKQAHDLVFPEICSYHHHQAFDLLQNLKHCQAS
ncbi:hypothetical protein STPYR_12343 [uncultured Stenotrophomonas sp.]|uniref:Uncharacterized protein n=1 Tax=uncultured Stenotrophomonas sp. TaxID=165438 RepID=A0A1Y5Q5A9_9GAMM|nr:hypothetical protein STPYR_12343 [uncultured Stenotrophomonas sp.]